MPCFVLGRHCLPAQLRVPYLMELASRDLEAGLHNIVTIWVLQEARELRGQHDLLDHLQNMGLGDWTCQ